MGQEPLTLSYHLSTPSIFGGVLGTRAFVVYVVFCISLFVFLSFFIRSLYCLSFDLQIMSTPLISSNFS